MSSSTQLRILILVLIFSITASSSSEAAVATTPIAPSVLHQQLLARGVGKGVKVTRIDGTVIKGTLVSIGEDSFQVAPKDSTQPVQILDTQVSKVGKDGMSTGAKVGIGVAIGATVFIVLVIVALRNSHLNIN